MLGLFFFLKLFYAFKRMFDFRTYARKSGFSNEIKRKIKREVTFSPDAKNERDV